MLFDLAKTLDSANTHTNAIAKKHRDKIAKIKDDLAKLSTFVDESNASHSAALQEAQLLRSALVRSGLVKRQEEESYLKQEARLLQKALLRSGVLESRPLLGAWVKKKLSLLASEADDEAASAEGGRLGAALRLQEDEISDVREASRDQTKEAPAPKALQGAGIRSAGRDRAVSPASPAPEAPAPEEVHAPAVEEVPSPEVHAPEDHADRKSVV